MSGKATGWVWDQDLPQHLKYILLAYADFADHEGHDIFPSVDLVAKMSGVHRRTVQRNTRELEKLGLLIEDGDDPKGRNRYRLPIKKGMTPTSPPTSGGVARVSEGGGTDVAPQGGTDATGGMAPAPPEPPVNPPEESSKKPPEDVRPSGRAPDVGKSRSKAKQTEIKNALALHFEELTGIDAPIGKSNGQVVGKWWIPISEILAKDMIDWDLQKAKDLLSAAWAESEEGEGFDVVSPRSLLSTCNAIIGKVKRGSYSPPGESQTRRAIRAYMKERNAR